MKLSLVIPAHNEEGSIAETVRGLHAALLSEGIPHEIVVVNDNSRDGTRRILAGLEKEVPTLRAIDNTPPNGFGFAVRCGLENFTGDAVAIVMADGSDRPEDVVKFYRKMQEGHDCVFGTRFSQGGKVVDYPVFKLVLNRLVNWFIKVIFQLPYNDTTNAFKMYRSYVIPGLRPVMSHHFNLTVELPLKAMIRGYSFAVVGNTWINRKSGESKLKIKEMGSRYLFIIIYCFIEKWLSRGDYHRLKLAKIQA